MSPKLLLLATIGYSVALGLYFGWRGNLRGLAIGAVIGAVFIEAGASEWGFNKGFSDTLLKQLLILFGAGIPIFYIARHASIWREACKPPSKAQKLKRSAPTLVIHLVGLANLWLPGIGLIFTGLGMLYARNRAQFLMPQLIDSIRFQASFSLMLICAYLLSAMPIGVYITAVVMLCGLGKVLVGTVVLMSGFEYRYCRRQGLVFKLLARLNRNGSNEPNHSL